MWRAHLLSVIDIPSQVRICLVDDIKTTGATLNECAKTLKEAGASKVFALVLSVAGQNAM